VVAGSNPVAPTIENIEVTSNIAPL